ncbi:MAG: cytochrome c oxidase subunit 3 [Elusimicrobiota bacterium]
MSVHRDDLGARIGMWLFLFTEMLLFGGLFLLYSAYRSLHPLEFHAAGSELNVALGVFNTLVLLTSSYTLALSLTAVEKGQAQLAKRLVAATILLGTVFLIVKGFEWSAEFRHGIYPNGPELLKRAPGEVLFFGLYFTMTGLHGLHILAGMALLSVALLKLAKGTVKRGESIFLENVGLYWHLVDVIWIFLLPLFYLAA